MAGLLLLAGCTLSNPNLQKGDTGSSKSSASEPAPVVK